MKYGSQEDEEENVEEDVIKGEMEVEVEEEEERLK